MSASDSEVEDEEVGGLTTHYLMQAAAALPGAPILNDATSSNSSSVANKAKPVAPKKHTKSSKADARPNNKSRKRKQEVMTLDDDANDQGSESNMDGEQLKQKTVLPSDIDISARWAIMARYYDEVNRKNDRLYHGALEEIAAQFNVNKRHVQRLVTEYKNQGLAGIVVPDLELVSNKTAQLDLPLDVEQNVRVMREENPEITVPELCSTYQERFGITVSNLDMYRLVVLLNASDKRTKKRKTDTRAAVGIAGESVEVDALTEADFTLASAAAAAAAIMQAHDSVLQQP